MGLQAVCWPVGAPDSSRSDSSRWEQAWDCLHQDRGWVVCPWPWWRNACLRWYDLPQSLHQCTCFSACIEELVLLMWCNVVLAARCALRSIWNEFKYTEILFLSTVSLQHASVICSCFNCSRICAHVFLLPAQADAATVSDSLRIASAILSDYPDASNE